MSNHDLEMLRVIDEVTAYATGADFFRTLVRNLARVLGARMSFVSRFSPDRQQVTLVAWWNGEQFVEDTTYPLPGSPCELVLHGQIVAIDAGVTERFPQEAAIGAESYLAIPLQSREGDCIGHLAVIDTCANRWSERDFGVLRLFAARAAAELIRQDYERELERRIRLERVVTDVSTAVVSTPDSQLDAEVDRALALIGGIVEADRARLMRLVDGSRFEVVYEWAAAGVEPMRRRVPGFGADDAPTIFARLQRQELVIVDAGNVPADCGPFHELMERQGVRTLVMAPMISAGALIGLLGFQSLRGMRSWGEADTRVLRLLAEIVASALARREQAALVESARALAESASRTKSEFVASMSHELRTPLNGILGYAQLLRRDPALGAEPLESVHAIERCGEHLLMLINDVLDIARIEAGRLQPSIAGVDLPDLLQSVADLARVRARQSGLAFHYEVASELPRHVDTDARRLRQILLNLLGNAIKFTETGTVRLRVSVSPGQGERARLVADVEDTGPGIEAAELERIFEPFHQAPMAGRLAEGTGLGLSISRHLAALLGGGIEVDSTPGRGSRFRVTIDVDVHESAGAVALSQRALIAGYEGPRRRVLLADDREDNRAILSRLLRPLGFEVIEARNGAEALAAAAIAPPDIVLMDLVMPGMDGFAAIRALRETAHGRELPVVALSASVFEQTREQCRVAGFCEFVPKPVDIDDLLDALGRLLQLDWIYRPPAAAVRTGSAQPSDGAAPPLPDALRLEVLDLARAGDIQALRAGLDAIERADGRHGAAVARLRQFATQYDMRSIRDYLLAAQPTEP